MQVCQWSRCDEALVQRSTDCGHTRENHGFGRHIRGTAGHGYCMIVSPLVIVVSFVGIAGFALVAIGRHGRRVDDHPTCRKCRFDLVGSTPGSSRCPECGADLKLAKAIRVGTRETHCGLVVAGVVIVVACIALNYRLVSAYLRTGYSVSEMPDWWLARNLDDGHGRPDEVIVAELHRRLTMGTVGRWNAGVAVERVLSLQQSPLGNWYTPWGDCVEAARVRGLVSDDQWRRYAAGAVDVVCEARSHVRTGDPWPVRVTVRTVKRGTFPSPFKIVSLDASWDHSNAANWPGFETHVLERGDSALASVLIHPSHYAAIGGVGLHRIAINVHTTLADLLGAVEQRSMSTDVTINVTATTRLLPDNAASAKPVLDTSLAPGIVFTGIMRRPGSSPGAKVVSGSVSIVTSKDAGLIAEVFLREEDGRELTPLLRDSVGAELPSNVITCAPGRACNLWVELPDGQVRGPNIALVLRPSRHLAISSTTVMDYWPHEVVVKDARVYVPPP